MALKRQGRPDNRELAGIETPTQFTFQCVRVGYSVTESIQFSALSASCSFSISTPTGAAFTQSERDLDLPEAAVRRAEGRASGKSDGTRSDRRETCGGRGRGDRTAKGGVIDE